MWRLPAQLLAVQGVGVVVGRILETRSRKLHHPRRPVAVAQLHAAAAVEAANYTRLEVGLIIGSN